MTVTLPHLGSITNNAASSDGAPRRYRRLLASCNQYVAVDLPELALLSTTNVTYESRISQKLLTALPCTLKELAVQQLPVGYAVW